MEESSQRDLKLRFGKEFSMNSPYKYHLTEHKGSEVIIHRASAPDVEGVAHEVGEAGCTIKQPSDGEESALYVFIAYEDMRGVGHVDHDYEQIG
jgi:hypothetical protein